MIPNAELLENAVADNYVTYNAYYMGLIRQFLIDSSIPYTEDTEEFGVFHLKEGLLQIRYINSWQNKMEYRKRFGIDGIPHKTFMNISAQNREKGIRTIYIKDFEIYSHNNVPQTDGSVLEEYHRKFEVVKSYIKTGTGNISTRFYARETEVRIVPNSELRPFLDTNCFYGYRSANINLGLYAKKDKGGIKKGELIMVYTFGHPFYGKTRWDIEVVRVATKLGCQCIGGASKLLKHFMTTYETLTMGGREVKADRLVFYVDADHNDGKSLETLGFEFIEINGPGFHNMWNVDADETCEISAKAKIGKKGDIFMRMPALHKLIMRYMAEGKVISISNAGTIVYLLERKKYFEMYPAKGD